MADNDPTPRPRAASRRPRIFFGWYIVFAGLLIQGLAYGGRYSFSVFFPTLLDQFHWPRDLTAAILSAHMLFYGLTAPLAGWVVDRLGNRWTMVVGTAGLASGLVLSGLGSEKWHFFLAYGVLTGVGLCLLGSVPLTMIIRNWFERRRGTAISLIYLGSALSYGCYPVVTWLIDGLGWRGAFAAEGIIILVLFLPLIFKVLYYHPSMKGLEKDGLDQQPASDHLRELEERRVVDKQWAATDWTLTQAIRTGRFWLCALLTFAMWGVPHHMLLTHHLAFALDLGFERHHAATILFFNGVFYGVGTLGSLFSDRFGREWVISLGTGFLLASIGALFLISRPDQDGMLFFYAAAEGLGYGICTPIVAAVMTDIFQGPRVGVVLGCLWFSFAMGGALGPWLGGWLYELLGGYGLAFGVAALLFAVGCLATWWAAPRKIRLVPGRIAR